MNGIRIIAVTDKGAKAIKQHYDESTKEKRSHRIMFKALGWKQTVISENPYTLELELTNRRLRAVVQDKHIISVIKETLKENGANDDDVYTEAF